MVGDIKIANMLLNLECTFCAKKFLVSGEFDDSSRDDKSLYCKRCMAAVFNVDVEKEYIRRTDLFRRGIYGTYCKSPVSDLIDCKIPEDKEDDYDVRDEGNTFYMCCICQGMFFKILNSDCEHKYCEECLGRQYDTHLNNNTDFRCAMCRKVYLEENDDSTFEHFKTINFKVLNIGIHYTNKEILKRRLRIFDNLRKFKFASSINTGHKSTRYRVIKSSQTKSRERDALMKRIAEKREKMIEKGIIRPAIKMEWFKTYYRNILFKSDYKSTKPIRKADYRSMKIKCDCEILDLNSLLCI